MYIYSIYIYISAGSGDPPLSSSNHQDDIISWLLGEPKENLDFPLLLGPGGLS